MTDSDIKLFNVKCWHDDYGDKWCRSTYIAESAAKAKQQHTDIYKMGFGKPMACIFLVGFSGYVDLEFLHPVKNKHRLYKLNLTSKNI